MKEVIAYTKENWLKEVQSILYQHAFTKIDEDTYENELVKNVGGQTITINGQRMEQPGQQVVIKNIVRFNGDGWVASVDEDGEPTDERCFTQVVLETFIKDNPQFHLEDCIYFDEPHLISNYIKQIFKL